MTLSDYQFMRYATAIVQIELAEQHVRAGEIAPHYFTLAWIEAWREIERISAQSRI